MTRNDTRNNGSSFGARVKQAQREKGVTNPVAAAEIGVSLRVYQLWRSGRTPSIGNVFKLADYYDKPPSYFLDGLEVVA